MRDSAWKMGVKLHAITAYALLDALACGVRRSSCRFFIAIAIGVMLPGSARAQARSNAIPASNGDGFDTHLFRPALDSRGFITVNGVDVVAANHVSLGLVLDWGHGVLRVPEMPNGGSGSPNATRLIDNSFAGTFMFNYGIGNRAVVGVSAPVLLMSGGEQPGITGWGPQALDAQSLGTVALHGKIKITRPDNDKGIGLALALQVGVLQ